MTVLDLISSRLVFADGGFGSLLIERGFPGGVPEEWNLSHPDAVESIHADYFRAGSDYVYANTFGSNRVKLAAYAKIVCHVVSYECEIWIAEQVLYVGSIPGA